MVISLVGYMASGKTVVAKQLAQQLSFKFEDLDDYLEKENGKSITDIFKEQGELGFRKKEQKALNQLLELDNLVLATGGGTPVYYNNMENINQKTISVYLQASPLILAKRLTNETKKRPLIAHLKTEELPEFIAKHLFERNPFYNQAQITINVNQLKVDEVVDTIMNHLPSLP